jgi:hypothetical protein
MLRQTHRRAAGALLAAAVLALAGGTAAQARHHGTIHLTEATANPQPAVVDTGTPGPSAGDVVVVRDALLPNGTLNQVCTLVHVSGGLFTSDYECAGSITLADGTITMEGPFVPAAAEQTAAITGGTGAYANARGEIVVRAEADEILVRLG